MKSIKLFECPRDAMQGWAKHISTEQKIRYINQLLKVGFDVLDCVSFVSHKAIPQMADSKDVLPKLELNSDSSKLLAIIANYRGAVDACSFDEVYYLGFPFSISETFQLRNTNKTILESFKQLEDIQQLCLQKGKKLLIYISMGFGNPYGDKYSIDLMFYWFKRLVDLGVGVISLADTVGVANPAIIEQAFSNLIPEFPNIEIGAHFHSLPAQWQEKIDAAYLNGCTHFDTTINGIGGCPMAEDDLVGNISTENLIWWMEQKGLPISINFDEYRIAQQMAAEIFF